MKTSDIVPGTILNVKTVSWFNNESDLVRHEIGDILLVVSVEMSVIKVTNSLTRHWPVITWISSHGAVMRDHVYVYIELCDVVEVIK